MEKDKLYADMVEACHESGCPMCRLMFGAMHSYMDSVMNEYVIDVPARAEMRDARGYCRRHAWYLPEGRGRVLGIAIIHDDIAKNVIRTIDAKNPKRAARRKAQDLLKRASASAECPACIYERTMEEVTTRAFLKYLHDDDFVAALTASAGLCLNHFYGALDMVRDIIAFERLVEIERATLAELQGELAEFIRKSDYRFRGETFGKEGDSWLRAIAQVSGEKGAR